MSTQTIPSDAYRRRSEHSSRAPECIACGRAVKPGDDWVADGSRLMHAACGLYRRPSERADGFPGPAR